MAEASNLKLSYFKVAGGGRAFPIRLIFAETGTPFNDYEFADGEFAKLKAEGAFTFGQAPVLTNEDTKWQLTQTLAIVWYTAEKFGLDKFSSLEDASLNKSYALSVMDLQAAIGRVVYGGGSDEDKAAGFKKIADETAPRFLAAFEKILSGENQFLLGDNISSADLIVFSVFGWMKKVVFNDDDKFLSAYPNLAAFFGKVVSRPKIAAYLASLK